MDRTHRLLSGGGVVINGDRIEDVVTHDSLAGLPDFSGEVIDVPDLTLIPGFIQTHIHLCQTLFRGLADDLPLLEWLRLRIFPLEAAHTASSMRASALLGLTELIASGSTTIMDMGSVYYEEEIVRAIDESGMRALVGKAMMDINEAYPRLKERTEDAVRSTVEEIRSWHGMANGRIQYAVAPRFILSCTDKLLLEASAIAAEYPGMRFHTHAAENRGELALVRKRCAADNIEYFAQIGILHEHTCLAHCIWLQERELDLLAERRAKVLHCPSSNLKLGSGIARVPDMLRRGITVSLGADGAPCNNTLNMFEEMRLAAMIQKPAYGPEAMLAAEVFAMATMGGATAVGLESEIGSVEVGKKADLVLLDLHRPWNPSRLTTPSDFFSAMVYSGSPANVDSVMVDGSWLYRKGLHQRIDGTRVVSQARQELTALLQRVEWT